MARVPSDASAAGGVSEIGETVDLVKRYVLQETVEPLKRIGWILANGIVGAFALGTGLIILDLALLRLLQTETGNAFADKWSFVPYVIAGLLAVVFLAFAVLAATGKYRRSPPSP